MQVLVCWPSASIWWYCGLIGSSQFGDISAITKAWRYKWLFFHKFLIPEYDHLIYPRSITTSCTHKNHIASPTLKYFTRHINAQSKNYLIPYVFAQVESSIKLQQDFTILAVFWVKTDAVKQSIWKQPCWRYQKVQELYTFQTFQGNMSRAPIVKIRTLELHKFICNPGTNILSWPILIVQILYLSGICDFSTLMHVCVCNMFEVAYEP